MQHLLEGPVIGHITEDRNRKKEKSPVLWGNQTHDLSVARRVLYAVLQPLPHNSEGFNDEDKTTDYIYANVNDGINHKSIPMVATVQVIPWSLADGYNQKVERM